MALGKRNSSVDPKKAGSVEAAVRRSLRAAVAGDLETAETWLERVVEVDSSDLHAYHALARLYRDQGEIGRAIRMHQNLILRGALDRREKQDALLELARDFDAGGFAARAAASYEELLDSDSRNPEILERLASLLHDLKDDARALVIARRLRRRDRAKGDRLEREILFSQARSHAERGENEDARAILKTCLRRHKDFAEGWVLLAELEAERDKPARAIDAWRRAYLADPTLGSEVFPKLDATYAARDRSAEFEKWLRALIEKSASDPGPRIALARLLVHRGDASDAIELLTRGVEVAPDDFDLQLELGRRLLASGQEAEALKAYAGLLDRLEMKSHGADSREEAATPDSGLDSPGDVP